MSLHSGVVLHEVVVLQVALVLGREDLLGLGDYGPSQVVLVLLANVA